MHCPERVEEGLKMENEAEPQISNYFFLRNNDWK